MPRVRAGFATRFVSLILAVLLTSASELCARQADAPAPAEPKPGAAPDRSGTKKTRTAPRPKARRDRPGFYMGRPIADVMSWQGVDWLFRETRVDEEQPEADVMKTWPCADFSFIRDLLRILSWCKPVFAGIEPILPTSLGTSPRRP